MPRISRLLTPLLAVSALLAAGAGPAYAGDEDTDRIWIDAPYELSLPGPAADGTVPAKTLNIGVYHDNERVEVPGGTLTVDVTDLAAVADITWPANCAEKVSGTGGDRKVVGECAFAETPLTPTVPAARVTLRARAGAANGTAGTVNYTARAGEFSTSWAETTVTVVDGPELGVGQLRERTGLVAGADIELPLVVTNHGNKPTGRTLLWLYASKGLDFATRYGNCEYADSSPTGDSVAGRAVCVLDEPLAAGGVYALDAGRLTSKSFMMYDRFDYWVEPYSAEALAEARAMWTFVRGTGAPLAARALPGQTPGAETPSAYGSASLKAVNTADLRLTGSAVSGAAGETVTASVTVTNDGPAWISSLYAGEPMTVVVNIPEGATVTQKPDSCSAQNAAGEWQRPQLGAPRYACATPTYLDNSGSLSFSFSLRIDRVVPGATGSAVTLNENPDLRISAFDPDLSNNETAIVVN
ncbi:hypothetical protein [Streptomyces paludis]|nr:hypothetical protein [Streptomyces paludis]